MPRPLLLAALLAVLSSAGCGTVGNLLTAAPGERAFGGVRWDLDRLDRYADKLPPTSDSSVILASVVVCVDMVLSFAGDILTYPLARWHDHWSTTPR